MGKLTETSVDFARQHLSQFYVSDFFPRPIELDAVLKNWAQVKAHLLSLDVSNEHRTASLLTSPWRKPRGGYRIVHQMDVLDCLVYTALAHSVAEPVEAARMPLASSTACAYRINLGEGSFFGSGNGYDTFRERSRQLADSYGFVLTADIVDFYNQIYLHRVQNAVAHAAPSFVEAANDIERFLLALNTKTSQGLPVGPAASIVFSEAVLNDVDSFLSDSGVTHTRYVDDFRIFANSRIELEKMHQELCVYLHSAHRLSLATEKTRIWSSADFAKTELNNPYEVAKEELLDELHEISDYSPGSAEFASPVTLNTALAKDRVREGMAGLVERSFLDLGLARALFRQARHLRLVEIVETTIDHLEKLRPALNSALLFLYIVHARYGVDQMADRIATWVEATTDFTPAERAWIDWLVLRARLFEKAPALRSWLAKSPDLVTQAQLACEERNVAWVRRHKDEAREYGTRARRAVLYASRVLPQDEREPWLKQFRRFFPNVTDQSLIKASLAWQDPLSFDDDDIPF